MSLPQCHKFEEAIKCNGNRLAPKLNFPYSMADSVVECIYHDLPNTRKHFTRWNFMQKFLLTWSTLYTESLCILSSHQGETFLLDVNFDSFFSKLCCHAYMQLRGLGIDCFDVRRINWLIKPQMFAILLHAVSTAKFFRCCRRRRSSEIPLKITSQINFRRNLFV